MTDLIACISAESGTAKHVKKVIEDENWDNVYVVSDSDVKFDCSKEVKYVIIDPKKLTHDIAEDIRTQLKGKIADTQVGVNLIAGTGKLHMAVISAILKLGLALRLIVLTPNGIEEL